MMQAENNKNEGSTVTKSFHRLNFINALAFAVNVFVTFAIGTGGAFGRPTNSELSAKYQTIVTPVGLMFSIWALIFLLQGMWVVLQFLPSYRRDEGVLQVGYLYLLAVVFQCGWTLAFSYEVIWLSLLFMYLLCASLVAATLRLQTYPKTWKGYFLWQFPISLHCGWIIAASAVNTSVMAVAAEASAGAQIAVASVSLAVLVLVAVAWLVANPVDLAVPSVLVWALIGVVLSLKDPVESLAATFSTSQIDGIKYASLAGLSFIAIGIAVKSTYVLLVHKDPTATVEEMEHNSDSKPEASGTDEESP